MTKKLSEQLADLSVRAKKAEDAMTAAENEAHDKIEARKQKAHAAATAAVEKVNRDIDTANDRASQHWSAVKAKVASDMQALKTYAHNAKHKLDVKHAENRADRLEWQAEFAIDYAIASVEQAQLAALDAIDSRLDAELTKQS